ncbi:DUF3892 domain-containing protein [Variovorax paradoxus]|uniref:DUF3892 domain-containing protein n=1 Tax=Variovorax paradoxus TaxID=34073 RepID=UPI0029C78750|nr:DUF3892 domain-containing protein [Variovorax paradoxus]
MASNYYVSHVRYNSDETHIQHLKVFEVGAEGKFSSGKPVEMTRPQAVEKIKAGSKFTTIIQKADKSWQTGAQLEIMPVETEYLKTKKDKSTRDNLESLPTF